MTLKTEMIIHASATRPEWAVGKTIEQVRDEITKWHVVERGWSGIGYNFIIMDGEVIGGRDLDDDGDFAEETGAHTKGHNRGTIGVCLIGGFGGAASDKFSDHYSEADDVALRALIEQMNDRFGDLKISGHNQYANKACPCFSVPDWLEGKAPKPARTSVTQSKTLQASTVTKVVAVATPVVAAAGDMPIKNLLVLVLFAAIILFATGVIDIERIKKWNRGDK